VAASQKFMAAMYSMDSSINKIVSKFKYFEPGEELDNEGHCKLPISSVFPLGGVGFPVFAKFVHRMQARLDAKSSSAVHLLLIGIW